MTIVASAVKFRAKPIEFEAVLFDGSNAEDVIDWVGPDLCEYVARPDEFVRSLSITTPEGARLADKGDWIIKGPFGVFYPLKPDLFETKFEPVEQFGSKKRNPQAREGAPPTTD